NNPQKQNLELPQRNESSFLEPKTFISECRKYINIELELAGVNKSNISISFKDSILIIMAKKNLSYQNFNGTFYRNPRSLGTYKRILKIGVNAIDRNSIKSSFIDNVLILRINK
ncbi:hypothetical protein DICPUDRAFT_21133, partial [Dictyostelium purpureum]